MSDRFTRRLFEYFGDRLTEDERRFAQLHWGNLGSSSNSSNECPSGDTDSADELVFETKIVRKLHRFLREITYFGMKPEAGSSFPAAPLTNPVISQALFEEINILLEEKYRDQSVA